VIVQNYPHFRDDVMAIIVMKSFWNEWKIGMFLISQRILYCCFFLKLEFMVSMQLSTHVKTHVKLYYVLKQMWYFSHFQRIYYQ